MKWCDFNQLAGVGKTPAVRPPALPRSERPRHVQGNTLDQLVHMVKEKLEKEIDINTIVEHVTSREGRGARGPREPDRLYTPRGGRCSQQWRSRARGRGVNRSERTAEERRCFVCNAPNHLLYSCLYGDNCHKCLHIARTTKDDCPALSIQYPYSTRPLW